VEEKGKDFGGDSLMVTYEKVSELLNKIVF